MDWFLCDGDLRHERVKALGFMLSNYIDLFRSQTFFQNQTKIPQVVFERCKIVEHDRRCRLLFCSISCRLSVSFGSQLVSSLQDKLRM